MNVMTLVVGKLEANCYILIHGNKCLLIDPGDDYHIIKEALKPYKLLGILITHCHSDHCLAVTKLMDEHNVPILTEANIEEKIYHLGSFYFKCLKTPGHSQDSISYYFPHEKILFSGDFLFRGSIGRCDLPTGSFIDMRKSLRKIKTIPGTTKILPGHGYPTTMAQEIKTNPYFYDL